MVDPIDEYVMQQLKDFEDKKFVCLTKEGVKFEETEEEKKAREENKASFEKLCTTIKEILGEKVDKVVLTERLATSPCILVTSEHGWSDLEDPSSYGERIHRMVKLGLSIDDDELPPAPVAASSEMDADDLAEGEGRMQEVD